MTKKTKKAKSLPQFDLRLKLDDEERARLGRELIEKINQTKMVLSDRFDRIRDWREQYDAPITPKDWPWPNAASLNIPTTRSIVDGLAADMYQVIAGVSPPFKVDATDPGEAEDARVVEMLLSYQTLEEIDIKAVWDESLDLSLCDANTLWEVDWLKTMNKRRDVRQVIDPLTNAVSRDDDGQPHHELYEEDSIDKDQPTVRVIDALNIVLYPANSQSVETATGIGYRYWANKYDLMCGVRDKVYEPDMVNRLLSQGADQPDTRRDENGGDSTSDDYSGVINADPVDSTDRSYQMFKVIWRYDYDGDGIAEDCVFHIEASTALIISATLLPYWHGCRNFINVCPYPRKKSFWGYSMSEILESLHAERNAIRNQRLDCGTLQNSPMLAIGLGARWDPNKDYFRPGGVVRVNDVDQIKPLNFANVSSASFSEESLVKEAAEDVSGMNSYANGQSPSRSRTLGEISAIIQATKKKLAVVVERIHRSNSELAKQILGLDYQYLPPEVEFAITGSPTRAFATITREQVRRRYKIVARGNTMNSNTELQIQTAETLYQIAKENPLVNTDFVKMWHVTNNYLVQAGIMNPIPYIGTEAEAQAKQQQKDAAIAAGPQLTLDDIRISGKSSELLTLAIALQHDDKLGPYLEQAAQLLPMLTGIEGATGTAGTPSMPGTYQAPPALMGGPAQAAQGMQMAQQQPQPQAQGAPQGINPAVMQALIAARSGQPAGHPMPQPVTPQEG